MRFYLTLELEKPTFPLDYRKVIISFIKNAMSKCNEGKYYDLYFKDTMQKDYCFSVEFSKCKFEKDKILLDRNEIKILFSTDDKLKTGFYLFSAFLAQKNKKFNIPNNNSMILKKVTKQKEQSIINSKVIFKTSKGSGICIRNHDKETNKDTHYVFSDDKFEENLQIVLKKQALEAGFSKYQSDNIGFKPIQCKKVLAKHYDTYIDLTVGMFQMECDSELLQYFYNTGVGSRKSAGFSMVDLVTQDLL